MLAFLPHLVHFLILNDDNISVHYTSASNGSNLGLFVWQTLYLIFPVIILCHIVFLWISLKKIIKSKTDNSEKILSAIISIFFPLFGPLVYLTTKQKSSI